MRVPRPKTRLAQAAAPVLAGIGVIAVIGLALWGVAVVASGNADKVRLGAPTFQVGRADRLADTVTKGGPLLFPGLVGPAGRVVAFEPDPKNLSYLHRHLARNAIANVTVVGEQLPLAQR